MQTKIHTCTYNWDIYIHICTDTYIDALLDIICSYRHIQADTSQYEQYIHIHTYEQFMNFCANSYLSCSYISISTIYAYMRLHMSTYEHAGSLMYATRNGHALSLRIARLWSTLDPARLCHSMPCPDWRQRSIVKIKYSGTRLNLQRKIDEALEGKLS